MATHFENNIHLLLRDVNVDSPPERRLDSLITNHSPESWKARLFRKCRLKISEADHADWIAVTLIKPLLCKPLVTCSAADDIGNLVRTIVRLPVVDAIGVRMVISHSHLDRMTIDDGRDFSHELTDLKLADRSAGVDDD